LSRERALGDRLAEEDEEQGVRIDLASAVRGRDLHDGGSARVLREEPAVVGELATRLLDAREDRDAAVLARTKCST